MDQTANQSASQADLVHPATDASAVRAEQEISKLSSLLANLDEASTARATTPAQRPTVRHDDRLAQARLGIASGLYTALRAKDPPTAGHCLHVQGWYGEEPELQGRGSVDPGTFQDCG